MYACLLLQPTRTTSDFTRLLHDEPPVHLHRNDSGILRGGGTIIVFRVVVVAVVSCCGSLTCWMRRPLGKFRPSLRFLKNSVLVGTSLLAPLAATNHGLQRGRLRLRSGRPRPGQPRRQLPAPRSEPQQSPRSGGAGYLHGPRQPRTLRHQPASRTPPGH